MGVPQSKSPMERKNTMVRRSQRKSIYTVRAKLDRIYLDIKKFRGIEQDEEYELILEQLDRLRYELSRKVKELQPQVRNFYQITMRRIDEAEEALEDQLEDNREFNKGLKDRKGKLKQLSASRARRSRSRTLDDSEDDYEDDDDSREEERHVETESKEEKEKRKAKLPSLTGFKRRFFKKKGDSDDEKAQSATNGKETDSDTEDARKQSFISQSSPELNKTVEMKLVKILTPSTSEIDVHASSSPEQIRSPDEKRKSILKVGIPVMPENMVNEITKKSQRLSVHYKEEKEREAESALASKVNKIIKQLEAAELDIAGFVGKRNGKRYNRIKDKLKATLAELSQYQTNDESTKESIARAKTYVGSCLAFLDEKAAENQEESDNDVFLPGNGSYAGSRQMSPAMSPTQDFFRYSKTTAI
nr:unnamed protein product [Callosobruchus chinensis]